MATKPEDWKFEFLTGKIWLLGVINWEDDKQTVHQYTCVSRFVHLQLQYKN